MPESPKVLQGIAETSGVPVERVSEVVAALRIAIDGLFLDGYTIFAPPFSLTYPTDPVAPVFADRWESASDDDIEAWYVGNLEASAGWLGVPLREYTRHPVASELMVFIELLDGLDIEDADSPEGTEAVAIARAWFDTFEKERTYRLSTVGLERDLEAWLIHHSERLHQIGYDARLRKQQLILPDRRRPDLVFDLTESDGGPGTLIVELKATSAYLGAVDQLVGYMDAFTSLGLADGVLRGLLVADGIPPEVLAYAEEKGIDTATLTQLGYRRDLASAPITTRVLSSPEPATGARDTEQTGAPMTPVYTVLFSEYPTLAPMPDRATPAVWITGEEGLPPTSITPVNETPLALALAEWARHEQRQGRTVGQMVDTFRGLHTYAVEGQIPDPANASDLVSGDDLL